MRGGCAGELRERARQRLAEVYKWLATPVQVLVDLATGQFTQVNGFWSYVAFAPNDG